MPSAIRKTSSSVNGVKVRGVELRVVLGIPVLPSKATFLITDVLIAAFFLLTALCVI